ncbi:MAG: DoxX family protein [Actinomycetota bacterium]|nr:DoxX family protein [Actinomycetota bacterium]
MTRAPAILTASQRQVSGKLVTPTLEHVIRSRPARIVVAVLRLSVGFVFLWTFFDKAFGLGYPTVTSRSWIRGGSPTQELLTGSTVVGPLKPLFAAVAGPAADILFMTGMLVVGLAVMFGVALRISAIIGSVMLLLMFLAAWSFDRNTGSTNPLVDSHIISALVLIAFASLSAGDTWGFGLDWRRLPLVKRMPWLV